MSSVFTDLWAKCKAKDDEELDATTKEFAVWKEEIEQGKMCK